MFLETLGIGSYQYLFTDIHKVLAMGLASGAVKLVIELERSIESWHPNTDFYIWFKPYAQGASIAVPISSFK